MSVAMIVNCSAADILIIEVGNRDDETGGMMRDFVEGEVNKKPPKPTV